MLAQKKFGRTEVVSSCGHIPFESKHTEDSEKGANEFRAGKTKGSTAALPRPTPALTVGDHFEANHLGRQLGDANRLK